MSKTCSTWPSQRSEKSAWWKRAILLFFANLFFGPNSNSHIDFPSHKKQKAPLTHPDSSAAQVPKYCVFASTAVNPTFFVCACVVCGSHPWTPACCRLSFTNWKLLKECCLPRLNWFSHYHAGMHEHHRLSLSALSNRRAACKAAWRRNLPRWSLIRKKQRTTWQNCCFPASARSSRPLSTNSCRCLTTSVQCIAAIYAWVLLQCLFLNCRIENREDPASLSHDALLTLLSAERKVKLQLLLFNIIYRMTNDHEIRVI